MCHKYILNSIPNKYIRFSARATLSKRQNWKVKCFQVFELVCFHDSYLQSFRDIRHKNSITNWSFYLNSKITTQWLDKNFEMAKGPEPFWTPEQFPNIVGRKLLSCNFEMGFTRKFDCRQCWIEEIFEKNFQGVLFVKPSFSFWVFGQNSFRFLTLKYSLSQVSPGHLNSQGNNALEGNNQPGQAV